MLLIEEALSHSLQERKIRYIFEGVSHLVAAIFVGAAPHIRKINEHGVKKMCRNIFAVQHTLTSSITGSRETALDSAKQYYELCNHRPQVSREYYFKILKAYYFEFFCHSDIS